MADYPDDGPYYEDIEVGDTLTFGSYEVSEAEIIEFATQYDPQRFHTDPEAAAQSFFGGLIASGWHTAAMTMRMLVDNHLSESRAMGAIGIDELRWPNPTRPGSTLSVTTEVLEKDMWAEGMGLVVSRSTTTDENDQTVMSMKGRILYQTRE
jgi:acyl dehydratase